MHADGKSTLASVSKWNSVKVNWKLLIKRSVFSQKNISHELAITGGKASISGIIIHQSILYELLSNLIGSHLPHYDLYYTDLPFMGHSSYSYGMDSPFMVDSIDSSAVSVNYSSSDRCSSTYFTSSDAAYDGFIN